METIADYADLRDRLDGLPDNVVVGIEGFCGSGKSYLAERLARDLLDTVVLDTDDHVAGKDERLPYVERIDYRRLKRALTTTSGAVLIHGICLRTIMRRFGVAPAMFIYVKRAATTGLWHGGLDLEDFENGAAGPSYEPHRSDFTYHAGDARTNSRTSCTAASNHDCQISSCGATKVACWSAMNTTDDEDGDGGRGEVLAARTSKRCTRASRNISREAGARLGSVAPRSAAQCKCRLAIRFQLRWLTRAMPALDEPGYPIRAAA